MAVFALSERFGCVRRCMPCKSCRKKKERRQTTHDDYDGYQPENNKAKKKKTRTTVETNTSKTWATWVWTQSSSSSPLWPPINQTGIFTHLKLCLAYAIHNIKWVIIIGTFQLGGKYFKIWLMHLQKVVFNRANQIHFKCDWQIHDVHCNVLNRMYCTLCSTLRSIHW